MLSELRNKENAWVIQAQITYNGRNECRGSLDVGGKRYFQNIAFEESIEEVEQGQPLKYRPFPGFMGGRIQPDLRFPPPPHVSPPQHPRHE